MNSALKSLRTLLVALLGSSFALSAASAADFTVTAPSTNSFYTINSQSPNPTLTLVRGQVYTFAVDTCSCHPFEIRGAPVNSVTNNNISSGTITFAVPATATNYTYRCSIHLFGGTITTVDPPSAPVVTTQAASGITGTGATLNAVINPKGNATTVEYVFAKDAALAVEPITVGANPAGNGTTEVASSVAISDLTPATTYYFRASATNTIGTTQGDVLSFTTLSDNSRLSNLALSAGDLSPDFDSGEVSYQFSTTDATTTVSATSVHPQASIKVNGTSLASGSTSAAIPLQGGTNSITVDVTAQDGVTKSSYQVSVTRLAPEVSVESVLGEVYVNNTKALAFDPMGVGISSNVSFVVRNVGAASLSGIAITLDGLHSDDFSIVSTVPASLGANESFVCDVACTPSAVGTRIARLRMASSDSDESPFFIHLVGNTNTVNFNTETFTVREDAITLIVPVILSAPLGRAWSVPVTYSGTATGTDYTQGVTTLNFTENQTQATLKLLIKDDNIPEGDETVIITLGTPSDNQIGLGKYRIINNGAMLVSESKFTLTITEDDILPVISPAPLSQIVAVNDPVTLTATVTGSAPLVTQWRKDNVPLFPPDPTTISIPVASLTDAGTYTITASNQRGKVFKTAELAVVDKAKTIVRANSSTSPKITVKANGKLLNYRWKKGTQFLANGSEYSGVTSKILTVLRANSDDSGIYTCVVKNPGGELESGEYELQIPTLQPIAQPAFPITVVYGDVNYDVGFDSDPARAPTKFLCSGLPPGVVCNPTTGRLMGRPMRPGTYTVTVTLSNNSGGTPTPVQAAFEVRAYPSEVIGTYTGVIGRCAGNDQMGAKIDLSVTGTATYTGKITIGTSVSAVHGRIILPAGSPPYLVAQIRRLKKPSATLLVNLGNGQTITGSYAQLGELAPAGVNGWRNVWRSLPVPALPRPAGTYSLKLDPDATGGPQGFSYATVSLSANGSIGTIGKMADGSMTSFTNVVGPSGEIPWYAVHNGGKSTSVGMLTIANTTPYRISGAISWQKILPTTDRDYAPFGPLTLQSEGALYSLTSTLPDAVDLLFADGGISSSATNPNVSATIASSSIVTIGTPNPGTVSVFPINGTNGMFQGRFTLLDAPSPPRLTMFQGIFVNGTGYGYFLLPQLATSGQSASATPILSGKVKIALPVP